MDYYKVLGVGEDADEQEIKKAYRKLSLRHHPDRGGNAEEFKKINEAYSTLGDKTKRQQYNMQRSNPYSSASIIVFRDHLTISSHTESP